MEITIKINGRMVTVEVSSEVAEYMDAGRRKAENLSHEKRRHWDEREFDEYIVATEGRLSCQPTLEDIVCQRETLELLLSILDTCTAVQREVFCSMHSTSTPMTILERCMAAPNMPSAILLKLSKKFSKNI